MNYKLPNVANTITGNNFGTIKDSYWMKASDKNISTLRNKDTFMNWDFIDIWTITDEQNYPHLFWEK